MRYIYNGHLNGYLGFNNDRAISVTFSNEDTFTLPLDKSVDGISFEFEGKISAASDDDAQTKARDMVIRVCQLLTLKLNAGVFDANILNVIPVDNSPHSVTRRIQYGSAFIVQGVNNPAEVNSYIKDKFDIIDNLDESVKLKTQLSLKLLNEARGSNDSICEYWCLFSILQLEYGDRAPLNNYLKSNHPEIPILHSDELATQGRNADVSQIIAIRDMFSHPATYGGLRLDPRSEINSVLSKMYIITENIISSYLT